MHPTVGTERAEASPANGGDRAGEGTGGALRGGSASPEGVRRAGRGWDRVVVGGHPPKSFRGWGGGGIG